MKRIILSLIFVMIALAGVSCASASDFNDTAVEIDPDINVVDDIDEVEINDTQTDSINDTDKAVENINEEIKDPIEYYSAQYKDLKEKYSQIWYSVPIYDALHELSTIIGQKYDRYTSIDLLTEIFCLVEFDNPSYIIKDVAYKMIYDLYESWHPWHGNNQKHDHKCPYDHSDRRKPLG